MNTATELLSNSNPAADSDNVFEHFSFDSLDELADNLVFWAQLDPNQTVLDPAAQVGHVLQAIDRHIKRRDLDDMQVDYCEQSPEYFTELDRLAEWCENNFLEYQQPDSYDRIIALPPVDDNADILHIRHMYDCLKPGGMLVSVASTNWLPRYGIHRPVEQQFRDWIRRLGDVVSYIILEPGTITQREADRRACVVLIRKPQD
jgi:16S rRNA G1207 methylase RsmC